MALKIEFYTYILCAKPLSNWIDNQTSKANSERQSFDTNPMLDKDGQSRNGQACLCERDSYMFRSCRP